MLWPALSAAEQFGQREQQPQLIEQRRITLQLVNQLNGRWKVKAEHLKALHEQAVSLIQQFADIKVTWVPRKANAEADALASTPLGPLRPKPKPSIDELPLE